MTTYVPYNRKRFVVPKKILEAAETAPPLPPTAFPFERLPTDIILYLFSNHANLPDLICLALSCKRFLHILTSVDSSTKILHYPINDENATVITPGGVSVDHDPSPYIVPVLQRLQSHSILPQEKVACHSCCRLRRIGTKSWWWDRCEEIYSTTTWRRRRNDRTWADRRVIDYEYHEFSSVFDWAWAMWKKHEVPRSKMYSLKENKMGSHEFRSSPQSRNTGLDASGSGNTTSDLQIALGSSDIEEKPKAICPECWATVEANKLNKRPNVKYWSGFQLGSMSSAGRC